MKVNELDVCMKLGIPIINNTRRYWLVRTKGGIYFNDFYLNNYIAVGWNLLTDVNLMKESRRDDLVVMLKKFYSKKETEEEEEDKEVKKTGNYELIATQLIRFSSEMKKGDIVIIPSQKSNNIAFGEVIDDEIVLETINEDDLEETQCPFIKRRKVRWLKRQTKDQIDIYLYKLLNSHHTITNANDYANIIDRALNSFYVKDNSAHFTMQVGAKEGIKIKQLSKLIDNNISIIDEFNKFSNTNIDVDGVDVKINLHSPGPVEIEGMIYPVLIIGMITIAICGGSLKFNRKNNGKECETGLEIKSDGLMEKIIKFMDHFKKNKLEGDKLKAKLEESRKNLKIQVNDDQHLQNSNGECAVGKDKRKK